MKEGSQEIERLIRICTTNHVYTLSTQTVEEARKEWAKLREQTGFQDTWVNVLQVE